MLRYRVEIEDAHAHLFRVTLTLPAPEAPQADPALQVFTLPVWVPGSYMVRDFSRHVSRLQARQGRSPRAIEQIDKSRWQVRCEGRAALVVSYCVYAFDGSVRGAFIDAERGFFNGACLLLRAEGRTDQPHALALGELPAGWQVATAMRQTRSGHCVAANYDELIDHPFELGRFWRGSFVAAGAVHEIVVSGALPSFDGPRLLQDTQALCEQQLRLWHGSRARQGIPFKRYLFLLHAAEEGLGGLEHRASSASLAPRRDLPRQRMQGLPEGYVKLLGLLSHEYFHAWNAKRLRPQDFAPMDLARENYTALLWFFEGLTSYYEDLALMRAGLIDLERYLRLLARTINAVAAMPGRHLQSLASASLDAWIKYYRADENTPNATVSYYDKGALVALALDLSLRRDGGSLDQVLRQLWRTHVEGGTGEITSKVTRNETSKVASKVAGDVEAKARGEIRGAITEADIAHALQQVSGRSYATELAAWVHGTAELPLAELLADLGVQVQRERAGLAATLGLRVAEGPVSGVQVRQVLAGGAAARAGLSAGDELLAIDGWRLRRLDDALGWIDSGQAFDVLLSRDQRVFTLRVQPQAGDPGAQTVALHLLAQPGSAVAQRRREWLDG